MNWYNAGSFLFHSSCTTFPRTSLPLSSFVLHPTSCVSSPLLFLLPLINCLRRCFFSSSSSPLLLFLNIVLRRFVHCFFFCFFFSLLFSFRWLTLSHEKWFVDCLWNSGVERSAYSLLGWKISRKFSSIKEQESSLSIVLEVLLKFVSAYWWKKKHEISSHSKWKNYSNSIIVFGIMLNFVKTNFHQDIAFSQFLIEWNMNKLKRFRKEKKLK